MNGRPSDERPIADARPTVDKTGSGSGMVGFLHLPAEIRNHIYELYFGDWVSVHHVQCHGTSRSGEGKRLALLRSHKLINKEATSLMFQKAIFSLAACDCWTETFDQWHELPHIWRQIQNLSIDHQSELELVWDVLLLHEKRCPCHCSYQLKCLDFKQSDAFKVDNPEDYVLLYRLIHCLGHHVSEIKLDMCYHDLELSVRFDGQSNMFRRGPDSWEAKDVYLNSLIRGLPIKMIHVTTPGGEALVNGTLKRSLFDEGHVLTKYWKRD